MVEKTNSSATDSAEVNEAEDNVNSDTTAENYGASRFSEDGMETEIEVTVEKPVPTEELKKKRKRKKKRKKEGEIENNTEEDAPQQKEQHKPVVEEASKPLPAKVDPESEDVESAKKMTKKRQLKKQMKKIRQNRLYPLHVTVICMTCFILPIAIYACDVIIGVNVLENTDVGLDLVTSQENMFNNLSAPLLSVAGHDYRHRFRLTVFHQVQYLAKFRGRRQVSLVESQSNDTSDYLLTTSTINTTENKAILPSEQSHVGNWSTTVQVPLLQTTSNQSTNATEQHTSSTVTSQEMTDVNATTETMFTQDIVTEVDATQTTTRYTEPSHQYCKHTIFFLDQHKELSEMASSDEEVEFDWYNNITSILSTYQQVLFFMFTVIGCISLFINMGLRVDAFLNEKWSSSLLIIFVLHMISMSLTAKVFALQSGANGVRCFLCRMVSGCIDIDPWGLRPDEYFPLKINWNTAAFVSIILKVCDCFVIGILTLKYVLDIDKDPVWMFMLKVVSWLLVFPLLVITPVTGVIVYSVLPVTVPLNLEVDLAMKVIFYIGIAFWALALLVLPFFCKIRMCNDNEIDYDEEEEY